LALAKPVGVSKKFHLLDLATSFHEPCSTGAATTRIARVSAFDNLDDDSSPDVRKAPSPGKTIEKRVSPPPSVSGEFLRFSFTIFPMGPDNFFCRSYPACALARVTAGESRRRPRVLPSSSKFYFGSAVLRCCACYDRLIYFTSACIVGKAA
jgi:hypothetical protein